MNSLPYLLSKVVGRFVSVYCVSVIGHSNEILCWKMPVPQESTAGWPHFDLYGYIFGFCPYPDSKFRLNQSTGNQIIRYNRMEFELLK